MWGHVDQKGLQSHNQTCNVQYETYFKNADTFTNEPLNATTDVGFSLIYSFQLDFQTDVLELLRFI